MYTPQADSKCFGNLLTDEFVSQSIPKSSEIKSKIEEIKGKAAVLSLAMFNPGKNVDISFDNGATFGTFFSQNKYGAGFTKGLAGILAYQISLDEDSSEELIEFKERVQEASNALFTRFNSGDQKLSDARQTLEKLDNFGGYYDRTNLSNNPIQEFAPQGITNGVAIDPVTKHLIVKVSPDLSEKLLDAYRNEINDHLTDEGKKHLAIPDNIGFLVVAYADELASIPQETLNGILNKEVSFTFKTPYIAPVRGDNRYALVASIIVDSPDIALIRNNLGLPELYSEGRPLRYTFGAVHNVPASVENLSQHLKNSKSTGPWIQLIENANKV